MHNQFDVAGRNCLAISAETSETPKINSQSGQQNVTTASEPILDGCPATTKAQPLNVRLQWGHVGFISDIDEHSFWGVIEFV